MVTQPVNDTVPFIQYDAVLGQDTFDFPWWIRETTDLQVYIDGELTVDYSVTGIQETDGGQVVLDTPLVADAVVTIASDFPFSRLSGFATSGSLRAVALNLELSYLVACILQLDRDQKRSLKMSITSSMNPSVLELPEAEDDHVIAWNGTAGGLKNGPTTGQIELAGVSATQAISAASEAEAFADSAQQWANLAQNAASRVVDIMNPIYGAKGDGVTDDLASIRAACADISAAGGGILRIPFTKNGFLCKRASTLTDRGAIFFSEISNVTIYFEPGAYLLIDNLNSGTGNGDQYSGIYIDGGRDGLVNGVAATHTAVGASDIFIVNPNIRWKTKAAARSSGYGVCCKGSASDVAANSWGYLRNVQVINGYTEKAPQGGAIFIGVDQPKVINWEANNTWADGCHFNACRRPQAHMVRGINVSDDVCPLVTYQDDSAPGGSGTYSPWNKPDLGTFSNTDCQISNVVAIGSSANAVRLNGVNGGSVDNVLSDGKNYGVQVDSAIAGGSYGWTVQASKKVRISNVRAYNGSIGCFMQTGNVTFASNQKFWDFSGIEFINCASYGMSSYGHHCLGAIYGVKFKNMFADKTCLLSDMRNCEIDGLTQDGDTSINLRLQGYSSTPATMSDMVFSNNRIRNVVCRGQSILFQDINGLELGDVVCTDSQGNGVSMVRVQNVIHSGTIFVRNPNRAASGSILRGVLLNKVKCARNLKIDIQHDATSISDLLNIGGSDATDVSNDISLEAVVHNTYNDALSHLTIQGGTYAPTNLDMKYSYFNGGEASPIWRTFQIRENSDGIQKVSADNGDTSITLTAGTSEVTQIFATAITAARTVTLSTSNARKGNKFRIVRKASATGAFNINVGSGPLKAMGTAGSFCDVEFDGSAWVLTGYGTL